MAGIITSIRDWLPSVAIVAGGLWVLFQWLFGERLRREKEMPALDGEMTAQIIECENGRMLVTVKAVWNNRSPLPVYFDIPKCTIDIFRFDSVAHKDNCALLMKRDLGAAIVTHYFLVGMCEVDYFFEPNTASTIISHFLLKPGIYGMRMELHTGKVGVYWWKELIVDVHPNGITPPHSPTPIPALTVHGAAGAKANSLQ